jgi:hypothetical protein
MTTDQQITGLQLRSLVKKSGEIELSLARQPVPEPAADQLVVRVEAAPINPSDLALLVGPADLSTLKISGTREQPVVTAAIPPNLMRGSGGACRSVLARRKRRRGRCHQGGVLSRGQASGWQGGRDAGRSDAAEHDAGGKLVCGGLIETCRCT